MEGNALRRNAKQKPATLGELPAVKCNGAGNGIRTREYQLGKLGPYHLAMPAYALSESA